ncbi:MAG: sugar ABC transporter permease [Propionicimonas sp.]
MVTATKTRPHLAPDSPPEANLRRGAFFSRVDLDRFVLPAPALILVLLLLAFPVGFTLYMSVHTWSGGRRPPQFVGLDNFARSLADERFWASLWHTVGFVSLSVGAQVLLGLAAALIFHQKFFGRGAVRAFYLFPMIATPTAIALVWKMMFDPTLGVLSYLSQSAGGPPITWTSDPQLVIPALAMVDTWQWTPLVMLIILSGLSALPQEPYEAARVDGSGALQTLWYITLPMLTPTILTAAMFRLIDCIKTFDIIMIITAGGPGFASETLNLYAFNTSLSFLNFGYGSALLVWLTVIVFGVALMISWLRRKGSEALS